MARGRAARRGTPAPRPRRRGHPGQRQPAGVGGEHQRGNPRAMDDGHAGRPGRGEARCGARPDCRRGAHPARDRQRTGSSRLGCDADDPPSAGRSAGVRRPGDGVRGVCGARALDGGRDVPCEHGTGRPPSRPARRPGRRTNVRDPPGSRRVAAVLAQARRAAPEGGPLHPAAGHAPRAGRQMDRGGGPLRRPVHPRPRGDHQPQQRVLELLPERPGAARQPAAELAAGFAERSPGQSRRLLHRRCPPVRGRSL